MSLTGNLEDLPLLDILQIVSFSKKTGYLGITTAAGDGAIVFRDGFVVASFAWDSPPADPRLLSLPPEKRALAVRQRIEMALAQLIRLREGQFHFSLAEAPPKLIGARDLSAETLDPGINPQELLLDLARDMDEDRRDSSAALEASFAEADETTGETEALPAAEPDALPAEDTSGGWRDPGPEYTALRDSLPEYTIPLKAITDIPLPGSKPRPTPPPPPEPPAAAEAPPAPAAAAVAPAEIGALLLVDDEDDVRSVLSESFAQGGFEVVEAEDPDSAIKKAQRLTHASVPFVLVTDLGMPASGGASFQGGFEVVKRIAKMNLRPPVLMMTETLSPAVRSRAKQMGISSIVFKPSLAKLDPEQHHADLRAFATKLLSDVLPRLRRPGGPPPKAPRPAPHAGPSAGADPGRDFKVLQQYLSALRGSSADASRISSLVMKVAREFFERGLLFLIKNDEVRGLGGFGASPEGVSLSLLAREIVIPLTVPSLFLDVVSSNRTLSGPLPAGQWTEQLLDRIGRFKADAAALLPLVAHRDTIAILFGDNPESGRPIGRLEALELFMNQAGIAMESALLSRKLRVAGQKE